MKSSAFAAATALLFATATATPMSQADSPVRRDVASPDPRSVAILTTIAPSSNTCANPPAAGECATAQEAAQPIIDSFQKYSISTPGEQAALLSWMAYETAEFKYKINHYPGRPGQGTRTMMMPNFVGEYAASLGITGANEVEILNNVDAAPGGEWGSAAWYLSTKCTDEVKEGLRSGGRTGWEAFITGCVQTTLDDGRVRYWTRAATALGMTV